MGIEASAFTRFFTTLLCFALLCFVVFAFCFTTIKYSGGVALWACFVSGSRLCFYLFVYFITLPKFYNFPQQK